MVDGTMLKQAESQETAISVFDRKRDDMGSMIRRCDAMSWDACTWAALLFVSSINVVDNGRGVKDAE
jgi:hypothetical protein